MQAGGDEFDYRALRRLRDCSMAHPWSSLPAGEQRTKVLGALVNSDRRFRTDFGGS